MTDKPVQNQVTLSKDKTDGVLYLPDSKCRVLLKHDTRGGDTPPGHGTPAETRISVDSNIDLTPDDPQQKHSRECLRRILTARFDEEEVLTLCFDMGLDHESLPGRGKQAKVRELLAYLERKGRLCEGGRVLKRQHPDVYQEIPWEVKNWARERSRERRRSFHQKREDIF